MQLRYKELKKSKNQTQRYSTKIKTKTKKGTVKKNYRGIITEANKRG